jgi:hypothetical protein
MKKQLKLIAGSLAATGIVAASAIGAVSADSTNGNVGLSDIPRSVFKQERLDAASQVLNTSTANIQAAHKNHSFSDLLSQADLTKTTYRPKLKAQLTSDLESKGYSQDQVTIALQHRHIEKLHHKDKSTSS